MWYVLSICSPLFFFQRGSSNCEYLPPTWPIIYIRDSVYDIWEMVVYSWLTLLSRKRVNKIIKLSIIYKRSDYTSARRECKQGQSNGGICSWFEPLLLNPSNYTFMVLVVLLSRSDAHLHHFKTALFKIPTTPFRPTITSVPNQNP